MKDTQRLRRTLYIALASFPFGLLPGLALADEPPPEPPPQVPTFAPEPLGGGPMGFSCPSGEATVSQQTAKDAAAKAAKDNPGQPTNELLGCPAFYGEMPIQSEPAGGTTSEHVQWANWSVNEEQTRKKQEAGEAVCVYQWMQLCGGGRLLAAGTEVIVAPTRPGLGWTDPQTHDLALSHTTTLTCEPALRRVLADGWLDDACTEHASIASFARSVLELMQLGAPSCLVAATQAAGLDEVRHAQRCFALAAAYSDTHLEPGTLTIPKPRDLDLPALAVATFLEGCIGETIGTLIAERALEHCNLTPIRGTLTEIIHDETRHAALAWATIQWALEVGSEPVRQAIQAAAQAAHPSNFASPSHDPNQKTSPDDLPEHLYPLLRAHGRLDPASQHQAALDAWHDIITPTLAAFGVVLS